MRLQGQFKSTLTCDACGFQSRSFSSFMFLTLPLPKHGRPTSIDECLELFAREERVGGDNQWLPWYRSLAAT